MSKAAAAAASMIDMNRKGRFTTTNNGSFAIRPRDGDDGNDPEEQTYSPDLYIRGDVVIDESTPLGQLIKMGLIVDSTSVAKHKKSGYKSFKFFRPLVDSINYDENDDPRDEPLTPVKKRKPDTETKNENDCLKFGEAMGIAMRSGEMNYVINHLQTDITDPEVCLRESPDLLFGEGIQKNRRLYEKAGPIDNDAVPEPGQSYAIVRRTLKKDKDNNILADYHIAFVIYQDSGINITLEAEANAGREYLPHFAFYDTNPDGYTFHRRWTGDLPGDDERKDALYSNGNTIVLQPKESVSPGKKRKAGGKKTNKKMTLHKKTMKSR
jgi:hypothetical protein